MSKPTPKELAERFELDTSTDDQYVREGCHAVDSTILGAAENLVDSIPEQCEAVRGRVLEHLAEAQKWARLSLLNTEIAEQHAGEHPEQIATETSDAGESTESDEEADAGSGSTEGPDEAPDAEKPSEGDESAGGDAEAEETKPETGG